MKIYQSNARSICKLRGITRKQSVQKRFPEAKTQFYSLIAKEKGASSSHWIWILLTSRSTHHVLTPVLWSFAHRAKISGH